MQAHEIIVRGMQSNCRLQVFELLAESMDQTRATTHAHSHRQVLAFNQAIDDSGSAGKLGHRQKSAFRPAELAGSAHFLPGAPFSQFAKCQFLQLVSGRAILACCLRSKL
jgi:hypothetical protein